MRGHGHKRGTDQSRKNGVLDREHAGDFLPAVFFWIETGGNEIGKMEWTSALHDLVPATGNGEVEQAKSSQRASDHD